MNRKKLAMVLASAVLTLAITAIASAQVCTFTTVKKTMTLNADCVTTTSIVVPNGYTLNGAGHTITGMDPLGNHFKGGVIQNGGASANVTSVTVTVAGLADICDGGADRLRGILFDGASGSITYTNVTNINQGASGCQEGNGIEVRNFGSSASTNKVVIDGNTVTGYQKNGITANGNVDAAINDNLVDALGPVAYIARNGIQIGFGGTGMIKRNTVLGNSYTGSSTISTGVLIFSDQSAGDPLCVGVQVMQNTIRENDIGVLAEQYGFDGFNAPTSATNVKIVNNTLSKAGVTNGYIYQAAVADIGNNDKIIANDISGAGYDPNTLPGATFAVDADPSFTNRAKVHANK
jgi:hypothetical protein